MKIIETNGNYSIYENGINLYDTLPVGVYKVKFDKWKGFYLVTQDVTPLDPAQKIYGNAEKRIDNVFNSFNSTTGNLGVILSGKKGIGKTLTSRCLIERGRELGIPTILVTSYMGGIVDFLDTIKQPVVLMFDEFEKVFRETEEGNPQEEMLPFFDGISKNHHLNIITINDISNLNEFLLNRPGRFRYHIRLGCPNNTEIREYLEDNLSPEYFSEIDKIISFSHQLELNYDCLHAIVEEINIGNGLFEDILPELNILSYNVRAQYDTSIYYQDGTIVKNKFWGNPFERDGFSGSLCPDKNYVSVRWEDNLAYYDDSVEAVILTGDVIRFSCDSDEPYVIDHIEFVRTESDKHTFVL